MANISGFGLSANLIATTSFPVGLFMTDFADDVDPLDVSDLQVADGAMTLNGTLLSWATPNVIKAALSVYPDSFSDINLRIILEANRVSQGKTGAQDEINLTLTYPKGNVIVLQKGVITNGMPATGVASSGRLKTNTYGFIFQSKIGG